MELIVDLHLHSHYSYATSKDSTLEGNYRWGKMKGITIIGTGDFTHPGWFTELKAKLEPAENGLFKLKKEIAAEIDKELPESVKNNIIRFVLTVEISNIYKKYGKVRKLHNIVIVPDFTTASKINSQLDRTGNLKGDGRPILGMDSKELLKITLDSHPDSLLIPAHVWTPWFGMFGSKSGFDSIDEAFEELATHIVAVETGLSSDPAMNWRLSQLENRTLVSHSDAHSPQKLGREANVINCGLSYKEIINAIKTNDERFIGTIEFFPEEGKYHVDGHRACNVILSPQESKSMNNICPVCSKTVTIGVEHRIDDLADRPCGYVPKKNKQVEFIIPLPEIVAVLKGVGVQSKAVSNEYLKIIRKLGSEFSILRKKNISQIKGEGFSELANLIDKMRKKEVIIKPGYDGVYGTVSF